MDMKKSAILIGSVILALGVNTASARCYGYGCTDRDSYGADNGGYEGYSGSRYQYDLSDPGDRIDYSIDIDAQHRDRMSVDPGRSLDRDLGQYGGGIYD